MTPFELVRTKLEIAYLHSKLTALIGQDLASRALSDWLEIEEFEVKDLIIYCGSLRYSAYVSAAIYHSLGFTYREISRLIGKSEPTIVNYLRRKDGPPLVMSAEQTPYTEEQWQQFRSRLDIKKQEMNMYGLRAKESII